MDTHLSENFYRDGGLHPRFKLLRERVSRKNGWFVPVSTLLDDLLEVRGHREITDHERARLERRWLLFKIRVGGTS